MTPTQQLGYNDQKAGTIDPDLSRADNPKGREYRDGMRQARREDVDSDARSHDQAGPSRDYIPPEWPVEPAEQVTPEAPARVVDTVDGFVATTPVREGQVVVVDDLSKTKRAEAPAIIEPVYEKKRTRKAKPVDADQGSLFA